MSQPKKTIAIIGATGHQGLSIAKTFASLPDWNVRAITRNPSSPKTNILRSLGCSITPADLDDIPSLEKAFSGVHAIFLNTDFWAPYRAALNAGFSQEESCKKGLETEIQHGKNAAIAAASAISTLEVLVYSALGPMNSASGGKYPTSYHWEAKAAIVSYIECSQPELWKKTSLIYIGAYATNGLLMPKPDPVTGEYKLVIPCSGAMRIPITDEDDSVGDWVHALIEGEEPGTKLLAYDSYLTIDECIEIWKRITGKEARLESLSLKEMHERTGHPYEVLWAPAYIEEFGYMAGITDWIEPGQLKKKVVRPSWEDWMGKRDLKELLSVEIVI
ncbi:NAD(P)-binding protein [Poronia punctata]|nr:NAD(P)-binding protein [Poronia punctata]